jgi:hypothetical protein
LVCEHFARSTEIPIKHVSAAWQLLPCGHYAYAGQSAQYQPLNSHPVLVEIMLPDLYALDRVERIIYATVDAVYSVSGMPKTNIFVQVNRARSGAVFDEGRIIHW